MLGAGEVRQNQYRMTALEEFFGFQRTGRSALRKSVGFSSHFVVVSSQNNGALHSSMAVVTGILALAGSIGYANVA